MQSLITAEMSSPLKPLNTSQSNISLKSGKKSPFRSPDIKATRYGPIKNSEIKFGTEQRFQWQKPLNLNDVAYNLPEMTMSRSVMFGYSLRPGMDAENPDVKKRTSTGPGSYDFARCFDHISEYSKKDGNRFACSARQSMALKTPSPGAVYNIEKKYYMGPEKGDGIGFANSTRMSLYGNSETANADMFIPKPETGPAITIAGRPKPTRFLNVGTPGAIYDVHVS